MGLGGLALSPELSVGGEGAWTGLVASVGGGAFAVCVRSPMGRSVVPGINRRGQRRRGGLDVPPPPGIVLSGGGQTLEKLSCFTYIAAGEHYYRLPQGSLSDERLDALPRNVVPII